jgi:hypothetical protein
MAGGGGVKMTENKIFWPVRKIENAAQMPTNFKGTVTQSYVRMKVGGWA